MGHVLSGRYYITQPVQGRGSLTGQHAKPVCGTHLGSMPHRSGISKIRLCRAAKHLAELARPHFWRGLTSHADDTVRLCFSKRKEQAEKSERQLAKEGHAHGPGNAAATALMLVTCCLPRKGKRTNQRKAPGRGKARPWTWPSRGRRRPCRHRTPQWWPRGPAAINALCTINKRFAPETMPVHCQLSCHVSVEHRAFTFDVAMTQNRFDEQSGAASHLEVWRDLTQRSKNLLRHIPLLGCG